ncbi:MAG: hypothetical protein N3D85_02960 [Candidatus Bathyarchaeota archaeon]|nr:hypothetical protein [Candidatus Bathyarchaeota archaeon]
MWCRGSLGFTVSLHVESFGKTMAAEKRRNIVKAKDCGYHGKQTKTKYQRTTLTFRKLAYGLVVQLA